MWCYEQTVATIVINVWEIPYTVLLLQVVMWDSHNWMTNFTQLMEIEPHIWLCTQNQATQVLQTVFIILPANSVAIKQERNSSDHSYHLMYNKNVTLKHIVCNVWR